MADDVGRGEPDLGDARDAAEEADRLDQSRGLAGRQVDLARVAGDDHLRVLAEPGEEHLHLHRRGVLRLVENDDGVGERAAAHEGERRHLDQARLQSALDLVGRHHVVERVVERAEIGVDLLAHVAGQEAEPLAGLDRRPRQDDALGRAALDHRRGIGDGEVGLAGAGRADAEDQIGAVEGADIGVLHHRPRHHGPAPGRNLGHGEPAARLERGQAQLRLRRLGEADRAVDVAGRDLVALLEPAVQDVEGEPGAGAGLLAAADGHLVAAGGGIDPEPLLDLREVAVELAEQRRHQPVVVEGDDDMGLVLGERRDGASDWRAGVQAATSAMPARVSGAWPVNVAEQAVGAGPGDRHALDRADQPGVAVDLHRRQPGRAADDLALMPSRPLEQHLRRHADPRRVEPGLRSP